MSLSPDEDSAGRKALTRDEPHGDGLDELLRSRLSRRAQLLRAGLLAALVALVAGGLLWRTVGFGAHAPTAQVPIPTLPVAPAGLRIISNVGFGSVTVNGRNVGALPAVAELRPGQNTVTLSAPPFRPRTCVITWPFGGTNDLACAVNMLSEPQSVMARGQRIYLGGELAIQIAGVDLATERCAQALGNVQRTLDATVLATTVPAGQHIATGGVSAEGVPASRTAPTNLRARLTVHAQAFDGRPCTSLQYGGIAQPYYAVPSPERAWAVNVPVLEQMAFVQADGKVIGHTAPIEGQVGLILDVPQVEGGDWRLVTIDPSLDNQIAGNLCSGGVKMLTNVFSLAHPTVSWGIGSSSDGGLEGCQLELDTIANGVETDRSYLWRFGVLLATDTAAHQLLPMLPIASAAELAAVRANS